MESFLLASVSPRAEHLFGVHWFTNSTFFALLVAGAIVAFVQISLSQVRLVPKGLQNFCEWIVETVYVMLEGIVGKHMIGRTFPLLASFFFFILVGNLSGLLPGVGTIGWGPGKSFLDVEVHAPIIRPANADLNMTLAMAIVGGVLWAYWTWCEVGPIGFLKELFAPKALLESKGKPLWLKLLSWLMNGILIPIFLLVGCIEVVSILSRCISLPVRLFGNVFAGENLLHAMSSIAGPVWSVFVMVPFFMLEVLVGMLQALVFMLLCAVYIKLSTTHPEDHH